MDIRLPENKLPHLCIINHVDGFSKNSLPYRAMYIVMGITFIHTNIIRIPDISIVNFVILSYHKEYIQYKVSLMPKYSCLVPSKSWKTEFSNFFFNNAMEYCLPWSLRSKVVFPLSVSVSWWSSVSVSCWSSLIQYLTFLKRDTGSLLIVGILRCMCIGLSGLVGFLTFPEQGKNGHVKILECSLVVNLIVESIRLIKSG